MEENESKTLEDLAGKELLAFLQSEYQALKQEQTVRISIRDNALYINFLAVGTIAAIAFGQQPPRLLFLLAIPLCACCVYAVYLNHDIMVSNLRHFFAEEFPRRVVVALCQRGQIEEVEVTRQVAEVLGSWEAFHRSRTAFRRPRKVLNTSFLLLNFLGTSAASLIASSGAAFHSGAWSVGWCMWIFDLVLVVGLAVVLTITSDI